MMNDEQIRKLAREIYACDVIAVDDDAYVSHTLDEHHAWVKAWVWVDTQPGGVDDEN